MLFPSFARIFALKANQHTKKKKNGLYAKDKMCTIHFILSILSHHQKLPFCLPIFVYVNVVSFPFSRLKFSTCYWLFNKYMYKYVLVVSRICIYEDFSDKATWICGGDRENRKYANITNTCHKSCCTTITKPSHVHIRVYMYLCRVQKELLNAFTSVKRSVALGGRSSQPFLPTPLSDFKSLFPPPIFTFSKKGVQLQNSIYSYCWIIFNKFQKRYF